MTELRVLRRMEESSPSGKVKVVGTVLLFIAIILNILLMFLGFWKATELVSNYHV